MSILLLDSEIREAYGKEAEKYPYSLGAPLYHGKQAIAKAQAKKILIKLQAIYNLPDEGMFHKKMGEFIEELMEEVGEDTNR